MPPVDGERGEERDVESLVRDNSKSDSYLHFGSAGGKASNLRADTTLCSARKLDLAGSGEVFNRLRVKWNNGTTAPGRAVDP